MDQKLKEKEAQLLLGEHWRLLTTKAPQSNFKVSENALRRGASVRPAQKIDALTLEASQSVIIDGDLDVSGVIEVGNNAALFVRGDLRAHDLCANGCVYVIGATKIEGIFYGAEEEFEAILCGEVSIGALLLHYNYQYIERGKRFGAHSANRRLWDEREGIEALQEAVHALGYHGAINAAALAQLLRMRSRWGAAQSAPARPAPGAKKVTKPATKKPTKKPLKKASSATKKKSPPKKASKKK